LKLAREFERVRKEGKAIRGNLLVLGALAVAEEKFFRAGFVTSRRIGNAIVRNRVRRRLREIVRGQQAELAPGWWLVVVARPAAAKATSAALETEWLRLARRAGILDKSCS
jgi:ribonuclease P protein component